MKSLLWVLLIAWIALPLLASCTDAQVEYQNRKRAWLAECVKSRPADSDAIWNCGYLWERQ